MKDEIVVTEKVLTTKEKLIDFIKNNNLSFTDSGSELNSECAIISGFALSLGVDHYDEIEMAVLTMNIDSNTNFEDELRKVFSYSKKNNYGKNWSSDAYKKMYKF